MKSRLELRLRKLEEKPNDPNAVRPIKTLLKIWERDKTKNFYELSDAELEALINYFEAENGHPHTGPFSDEELEELIGGTASNESQS